MSRILEPGWEMDEVTERMLKVIEMKGETTQAELVGETGMSRKAVWDRVQWMLREGKIHEAGKLPARGRGRREVSYDVGPVPEAEAYRPETGIMAAMDAMDAIVRMGRMGAGDE